MNRFIVFEARPLAFRTARNLSAVVGAIWVLVSAVHAQIINGSFESNDFTGWDTTPGDFIIGHNPKEPVGTDGYLCADLGGGDIAGAVLSQTIKNFAHGGTYQLNYDSACNAGNVLGLTTVWGVLVTADGQQIASQTLSQKNFGPLARSFGFIHRQMTFHVASDVQNIAISFKDMTPGGGIGIDTAIDLVSVSPLPETGGAAMTGLAVAIGMVIWVWLMWVWRRAAEARH